MNKNKIYIWIFIFFILICIPVHNLSADGGYFSSESVAVSADQRAIIIKNGDEISMTFSTGYTGEGENFAWIIPTPVPPAIEDVSEAGENGEKAFEMLDSLTAPVIITTGGGCFPAGTEVLTASGPRSIETVEPGTAIYSFNLSTGKWVLKKILKRLIHHYEGDMVTINMDQITIQATGNHPFYVLRGDQLFSRPLPQDIPKEEQHTAGRGRWVEARNLREGDLLQNKSGEVLMVTSLSSRQEKTEVYNLNVENNHNYAVHRRGFLVHNKGGKEDSETLSTSPVTVYGTVTLEHYQISILGAAAGSDLINWLRENNYQVNTEAEEVLDTYIEKNWAFVAVKLNPGERRHYENEFLPPLTIKYQHDQLIFPLHISSVSTTQTAKITLYVIAESTVSSSNFQTMPLRYNIYLPDGEYPKSYFEACIRETTGKGGGILAIMWSGEVYDKRAIYQLLKNAFPMYKKVYLTRFETRIDPAAMIEDIRFKLDKIVKEFRVHIKEGKASAQRRESTELLIASIFMVIIMSILFGLLIGFYRKFLKRPEGSDDKEGG